MDLGLSLVFAGLCAVLIVRMIKLRDIVDFQLGVIAFFSIGYFCLPVWFKGLSRLQFYPSEDVARAVLLFLTFAAFVTIGTWIGRPLISSSVRFSTLDLDAVLLRHRKVLTLCAMAWYVYYYTTFELTSYSAEDFTSYFSSQGGSSAVASALGNIALGWIALSVALALRDRRLREAAVYAGLLAVCVVMLLFVGQRLAFLSPIVMLMASLAMTGQTRGAAKTLIVGVVALLLVSPVAVAVREAPEGVDAAEAIATFDYGDDPFETVFQSVIDRGDLLYVTVEMMPRIDDDPVPGWTYYSSALLNGIPSALYPGGSKPYLLSTDGQPSGELSVYAWRSLVGSNIGSLSAFGGLVAYREAGWIGVVLNGLLTGVLFVFLYRWLGRGGLLCQVVYALLFVSLTVKKVPPSLWETVGEIMPLVPVLLLIYVLNNLCAKERRASLRPA